MVKALKKLRLGSGADLIRVLEEVHSDHTPFLIERDGESLAVIIHPEEYGAGTGGPTEAGTSRALKAAGSWKGLDTDALLESIYRARHEGPPSAPVAL